MSVENVDNANSAKYSAIVDDFKGGRSSQALDQIDDMAASIMDESKDSKKQLTRDQAINKISLVRYFIIP